MLDRLDAALAKAGRELSHLTIYSVIPSEAASLPRAKSRGAAPVGMTEVFVKCDSPTRWRDRSLIARLDHAAGLERLTLLYARRARGRAETLLTN